MLRQHAAHLLVRQVLMKTYRAVRIGKDDQMSDQRQRHCRESIPTAASVISQAVRCAFVMAAALTVTLAVGTVPTAHADPAAPAPPPPPPEEPSPWPDIRYYQQLDANTFALPGGVWFVAPTGQNCGIWGRGNFGCTGYIPGAPAGVSHIGWINGDRAVHYDWSMAVRFPATRAEKPLPPRSFIQHEGTKCAVTPDNRTFCERGPMKFVIEPTKTWLSAPWTDQSWRWLGPTDTRPVQSPPG